MKLILWLGGITASAAVAYLIFLWIEREAHKIKREDAEVMRDWREDQGD